MTTMKTLDSSILSFIILGIIYINVHKRSDKVTLRNRYFLSLVRLNMAVIIIDILSWTFNGRPGAVNLVLNTVFNLSLYLLEPLAPILWIRYMALQVFRDESKIGNIKNPFMMVFWFNALLSILSLFTGWIFAVTSNNVYHRGDFYWVHILLCFSLLAYSFLFIAHFRNRLEKSQYYALLFFAVPPVLGSTLQALFYGISLTWSGMALSLLIVFIYIQNRSLSTDYLTGVYNRRQLDTYIKKKIRKSSDNKSFSVILIDLNDFKQINDTFGHDAGDKALRVTVNIVKSCLSKEDFMARYGGDEFYIIMDLSDPSLLESTINQIDLAIRKFNSESKLPYQISISMGYDIYRYDENLDGDDFLKHVDMLMYKNKMATKRE